MGHSRAVEVQINSKAVLQKYFICDLDSNAICLCFSLSDRASFVNLTHWLDQIKGFDVQGQIYLIGCKSDLDANVPTDEILIFAQAYQVKYLQTSAKDNVGVSEAFRQIVEEAAQANLINMAYSKVKEEQPKMDILKQAGKKSCSC